MIGQTIAHYEVTGKLGEGGMGVVYRARDTKLNRDVAIKVLPEALAGDSARMERFRREARLLAQLNHPNIASIYGVEESDGVFALVMELAEGPTLAERLENGPLPGDEVIPVVKQIAEALEAAHEKGIIHRDLKPANIKVGSEGQVNVLDFGLAKALEDEAASEDLENSPTLTVGATKAGVILGTAAYMSPEQARGRAADKRSDIWSFGVVLYEMLTGRQIFAGETVSDSLASVLKSEIDFGALPEDTPPSVRGVLRRCLQRDRRSRLRDIGDARLELEETPTADGTAAAPVPAPAPRQSLVWVVLFAAAAFAFLAVSFVHFRETPPETPLRRFAITPPEFNRPLEHRPAISPNGRHIAYVAGVPGRAGGESALWIQDLDQDVPRMVASSDGARKPFWSPASDFVGFIQEGSLRKVPVEGEPTITVCALPGSVGSHNFFYGAWSTDGDSIVFSAVSPGLFEVSARGGTPFTLLEPSESDAPRFYSGLSFLPRGVGSRILVFTTGTKYTRGEILVRNLDTGEERSLKVQGALPRYSPTGHIVYQDDARVAGGALWAAPFSAESLEVTGDPFPLTQNASWASIADDGTLVHRQGGSTLRERLVWRSRAGVSVEDVDGEWRTIYHPSLSPDGRKLMVAVLGADSGNFDIWIRDLERSVWARITNDPNLDVIGVWSPTGDRIAFMSDRGGGFDIFLRAPDGSGDAMPLVTHAHLDIVSDWSADGRNLIFFRIDPTRQRDLWRLEQQTGGDRFEEHPVLTTEHSERTGDLSPDGRWLAYVSDRSGRDEVYVRSFPEGDRETRASADGGNQPRWSRDGTELFYVAGETLTAVPITTEAALSAGNAEKLFSDPGLVQPVPGARRYDVGLDGKRFVVVTPVAEAGESPATIRVVENWFEEFRERQQGQGR